MMVMMVNRKKGVPGGSPQFNNHGDSESSKPALFPLQMAVSRLINGG